MAKEKYVESGKAAQEWVNTQVQVGIASRGGITQQEEEHIILEGMRRFGLSEGTIAGMIITAFVLSKEKG